MLASFHQMGGIKFGEYDASITLVGRRAAQRAGVRHWRRGADPQVIMHNADRVGMMQNEIALAWIVEKARLGSSMPLAPLKLTGAHEELTSMRMRPQSRHLTSSCPRHFRILAADAS